MASDIPSSTTTTTCNVSSSGGFLSSFSVVSFLSVQRPNIYAWTIIFVLIMVWFAYLSNGVEASFDQLDQMYCGHDNCYDLLGVTRSSATPEIKKSYRRLSLKYHPDRNADPEAVGEFRKIAKAYEVLSAREVREAYNYYLDHPDDLYALYYGIRAVYPKKTNPFVVVIITLAFLSLAQFMNSHYQYKRTIGDIQRSPLFQRAVQDELTKQHGAKFKKLSDQEQTSLRKNVEVSILSSRVQLNDEGTISQPISWRDVCVVRCLFLPATLYSLLKFYARWVWKFVIMGDEYGQEEKEYLTKRKAELSDSKWISLTEAEREELLEKELWIKANYDTYQKTKAEEEKEKRLSSTRYRQWKRWKKRNQDTSYMMED